MTVGHTRLIDEVMWRSGLGDAAVAETAVATVLEALGCLLPPADARFLAGALPPAFARAMAAADRHAFRDPSALYARFSVSEDIDLGVAMEHANATCGALADALDAESRLLLARRLPPEWAALFAPVPRAPARDAAPGTVPGHGHTLATGRPGSRRPLAESAPPAAQSDSVVTEDNPHGADKLSSASETAGPSPIATARPGAEEPLADARDERVRR
jgi:uncharacterized protein (DUF2267 family)